MWTLWKPSRKPYRDPMRRETAGINTMDDHTPHIHVRDVLAYGDGDKGCLTAMSDSMDTFTQVRETCPGVLLPLSLGNIEDETSFRAQRRPGTWTRL